MPTRFLPLFLPACFVLLISSTTWAQKVGLLSYSESATSVTITACEPWVNEPVVIPAEINGKPVTQIADGAFRSCWIPSVSIPEGVTIIGPTTFYGCGNLTKISLPTSLKSIDAEAFSHCSKLTAITIPSKVNYIGLSAFESCHALKSIVLPKSLKNIGNYAFRVCGSMKSATFLGNAPGPALDLFMETNSAFKIYFHEGMSGFSTPSWRGYPCRKLSPEITVFQPAEKSLKDGVSTKSFADAKVRKTGTTRIFTIRNDGKIPLSRILVTTSGANAMDFQLAPPAKTSLAPGESVKFKVTFTPKAKGNRMASIRIRSTDRDESPFEIGLTGVGSVK